MHTIVRTGRARGGHWLYCSCGWVSQPVLNAAEIEAAHASHRGVVVGHPAASCVSQRAGVLAPA